MDESNSELSELLSEYKIQASVRLKGEVDDIREIYRDVDVVCLSSSSGEGSPLALAEAMSCGLPPVVTDVGDMPRMIGEVGLVVPRQNHFALSSALAEILSLTREQRTSLGERARQQIRDSFSIESIGKQYANVWSSVKHTNN